MQIDYPQFGTIEDRAYYMPRIKSVAQGIRALSKQPESGPFDPFAFARDIGIEVVSIELPSNCSGRLRTDRGYALIELNAKEPRVRQRFTLCHELAHICFWSGGPVVKERGLVCVKTSKFELEEKLCNQIASELLMPSDVFVAVAKRMAPSYHNLRQLTQHFDVSMLAVMKEIGKTKGHGWISATLSWVHSCGSSLVRSAGVKMGRAGQRGQRKIRATEIANDAFSRAERAIESCPLILASVEYRYVPLAMSHPEVIIWKGRSPIRGPREVIHGAAFFAL